MKEKERIQEILEFFSSQSLAVLGTHQSGQPYGSLVAFAATSHLKNLFFATTRATRKFANLQADSRVSMVLDNRSNRVVDFGKAVEFSVTFHKWGVQKAPPPGVFKENAIGPIWVTLHPFDYRGGFN